MNHESDKDKVREYYDNKVKEYTEMYKKGYDKYPTNLIRIDIISKLMEKKGIRSVLDVGCGSCGPMILLMKKGFKVKGFDFSKEMIKVGKQELKKENFDPDLIVEGDIENESSFPNETFDAMISLGVFPHIDEKKSLLNMRSHLDKNGIVYIEFRNDLFATFSLNKYSVDFFLNRMIDMDSLPKEIQNEVIEFYGLKLGLEKPKRIGDGRISYDTILANFHNPLTIANELFNPNGFTVNNIHFYHYHVLPPIFDEKYPSLFRELSLKIENPNDWKGYFMASAFVVEATKNNNL